jgi:hypothetical protein
LKQETIDKINILKEAQEKLNKVIELLEEDNEEDEIVSCCYCGGKCEMNTEYEGSAVCKDKNCKAHKEDEEDSALQEKAQLMAVTELKRQLKLVKDGERFMSNGTYNHPNEDYLKYNASDVEDVEVELPISFVEGANKNNLMDAYNVYYIMKDGTSIKEYNPEVWFDEKFEI